MDYERARLMLCRDMGAMTIDERGLWHVVEQKRCADLSELEERAVAVAKVLGW